MRAYLLRRLWQSAVTLAGVSLLVFVILRVIPGDPAKMLLPEGAPQSAVDALNRELGLREPIWVQYGIFLRSVIRGDFGQSFQYRAPALRVVAERAPATIQLALTAMALTVLVGVSIGIVAAVRQGSAYDYAGTVLAVLGQSLPNFWLGIMLMLLFGVTLRWLPTSGFHGWQSLVLPSVTLAAFPTAPVARLTRSSLLEILGQEYIRTGRAKGLGEPRVVLRHALKNATIPLLTVLGLQIGTLLGGAVITESIFAWPGMGKLVVDAIFFRDFLVVQTVLILSATIFVVINLLVDLLYTVLDPPIRSGRRSLNGCGRRRVSAASPRIRSAPTTWAATSSRACSMADVSRSCWPPARWRSPPASACSWACWPAWWAAGSTTSSCGWPTCSWRVP